MKLIYLLILILLLFLGLNYRQLYAAWAIRSESSRLEEMALNATEEYQNPAPLEDKFDRKLSPKFWNFSVTNGGGKASNESAWHATAVTFEDGLAINHFPDTEFESESSTRGQPAAERYNNVTLIGASGFRPSPSNDVVLRFASR